MLVALARIIYLVEAQQHHRGIIHVGIKLVIEFEIPSTGFDLAHLHRPVTLLPDFFAQNPVGSLYQPGIILGHAALSQGKHCIRGVPHGRHARLHAEGWFGMVGNAVFFNAQFFKLIEGANDLRIVGRIAQATQGNE